MRLSVLSALAVGFLVAADEPKKEEVEKELAKLKGTWVVTTMVRNGNENEAQGDTVTFDGNKMTVKTKGPEHGGTCKLDPGKKPKVIDLIPSDGSMKDKVHPGIYVLDGDTLKICFADPDKTRPMAFESKEGSDVHLVTLKREKK